MQSFVTLVSQCSFRLRNNCWLLITLGQLSRSRKTLLLMFRFHYSGIFDINKTTKSDLKVVIDRWKVFQCNLTWWSHWCDKLGKRRLIDRKGVRVSDVLEAWISKPSPLHGRCEKVSIFFIGPFATPSALCRSLNCVCDVTLFGPLSCLSFSLLDNTFLTIKTCH